MTFDTYNCSLVVTFLLSSNVSHSLFIQMQKGTFDYYSFLNLFKLDKYFKFGILANKVRSLTSSEFSNIIISKVCV